MKIREVENYKRIIQDSYVHPGEGIMLSHIWYIIELHNKDYTIQQKKSALLIIIRQLVEKGLIKANKVFQVGEDKPFWMKGVDEYIALLEEFLSNIPSNEFEENDPGYVFIRFEYEFIDWQIDWPVDLKKYGLE